MIINKSINLTKKCGLCSKKYTLKINKGDICEYEHPKQSKKVATQTRRGDISKGIKQQKVSHSAPPIYAPTSNVVRGRGQSELWQWALVATPLNSCSICIAAGVSFFLTRSIIDSIVASFAIQNKLCFNSIEMQMKETAKSRQSSTRLDRKDKVKNLENCGDDWKKLKTCLPNLSGLKKCSSKQNLVKDRWICYVRLNSPKINY